MSANSRRRPEDEEDDIPPLPEGFGPPAQTQPPPARQGGPLVATGQAHDGDTFGLTDGRNARLYGVDAFELQQTGRDQAGAPVPLGANSRSALLPYLQGSTVKPTGGNTYGRPVATVGGPRGDAGLGMVSSGNALPAPNYLQIDPNRLNDYMQAQRDAIAAERGAYGGQYQNPADFRKLGEAAPMLGKRPMTEQQAQEYGALVRNPKTTIDQLQAWAKTNGGELANAENILSFYRRNPNAVVPDFFQQRDAQDAAVMPDGQNVVTRHLGALNEGIADTLGAPVDIMNAGMGAIGLPMSDKPLLGSESIRSGMHWLGMGQTDQSYAPRSDLERYSQSFSRGVGQAVVPAGALPAMGGRAALSVAPRLGAPTASGLAVRDMLSEAARRPGVIVAGEVGAGAGSGLGAQVADDYAPGNPWASMAGQLVGGVAGGLGAGVPASRFGNREGLPLPGRTPPTGSQGPDFTNIDQGGALTFNVSDETPAAPRATKAPPRADYERFANNLSPEMRVRAMEAYNSGQMGALPESSRSPDILAVQQSQPGEDIAGVDLSQRPYGGQVAEMRSGMEPETLTGPRVPDRIDIGDTPPLPPGFGPAVEPIGAPSARPLLHRPSPNELAASVNRIQPGDVTPIPNNAVESMEEAARIGADMRPLVRPVDEYAGLETRYTPSPRDGTRQLPHKGPLDMVSWLRAQGGLRPSGEIAAMGIDNAPRGLDFAQGEQRMGRLVDPDRGMGLDEAADAAWRAGYMPGFNERPTIDEFLGVLGDTHSGRNRAFLNQDLPEIDRFYGHQDQRYRIMQAEQEGAPLADDLGRTITQADLDANTPPITAYEDLPKVGGRVGNINLANVETRGDIRRLLKTTEHSLGGFDAARRGRISQDETAALASELKMTPDQLLKRRHGQAFNAEEALAARITLAKSSDEMLNLARKAQTGGDDELLAFRQAMIKHAAIQEQVTGMTAEAGRTLAQFKMAARSRAANFRVHQAMLDAGQGRDGIRDAAAAILDLQARGVDPGTLNRTAADMVKPNTKDKLVELWYNALLSSPATHAVNVTSNLVTSAFQIPEHLVAAGFGQISKAMGGADRVTMRELGPRMAGWAQGLVEGLPTALRTLKTGDVPDFVTKVEARTQRAIPGVAGSIIRTPSRALAAEDEMFKAMARRMEINGLAHRRAAAENLKGDAYNQRVADLQANPTGDMIEKALDYGRYLTFQRPLTGLPLSVSQMTQRTPALKLIIPFVRTPVNILKFAAERSPGAVAMPSWRADIAAGGARRNLAFAKATVGTAIMASVMMAADQGLITGSGPLDENAEQIMRADGWQPNSVKVGDTYYSYSRLDPFAMTMGVAADLAEKGDVMTPKQRKDAVGLLASSIVNNLANKTWLSGVADFTQALSDWQRYGGGFTNRLAGSATVPAVVANTARAIDPVQRDVRGAGDAIINRIPGMSDSLPAKRDVWGREIRREGGLGPDFMSPIWTGGAKNDPLNREMLDIGARFGKPRREDYMSPDQYSTFSMIVGMTAEQSIRNMMGGPGWALATKDQRAKMAEDAYDDARDTVKAQMFNRGPKARKPKLDRVPLLNGAPASMGVPPPPPGFGGLPVPQ